jgi:hypothetical protein
VWECVGVLDGQPRDVHVDAINTVGYPRVASRRLASLHVVDSTVSAAQLQF